MVRLNKGEQPLIFGKRLHIRVHILRSHVIQKVKNYPIIEMSHETKAVYVEQYGEMALVIEENSFSNFDTNFNKPMHNNKNSIPKKRNFKYGNRKSISFSPNTFNICHQPPSHQFQNCCYPNILASFEPNFQPKYPTVNSNFNSFNANNPTNFRQQINIQPRPVPQRKLVTNEQVFRRPKNVYAPTGEISNDRSKPMSGISHNMTTTTTTKELGISSNENHQILHLQNYIKQTRTAQNSKDLNSFSGQPSCSYEFDKGTLPIC